MPRQVLEFRVVVASPSDMYEARKTVFNVLHELNRVFEIQRISIRGLGWEEYVTPGIAADSQAVINEQILTEYDILVAIFGTKLGTPTANFPSGTVEEVENAITNSANVFGKYRVQIYFRDKIENVSTISIEEFKKVAEFRDSLKARGVLYRLFTDDGDLQKEVRANIERPILEYIRQRGVELPLVSTQPNGVAAASDVDNSVKSGLEEFGVLDFFDKAESSLAASIASASRITPIVNEIAAEMNRQVAVFEQSVGLPAGQKRLW